MGEEEVVVEPESELESEPERAVVGFRAFDFECLRGYVIRSVLVIVVIWGNERLNDVQHALVCSEKQRA